MIWLWIRSSCLCLWSAEILGVCYHIWLHRWTILLSRNQSLGIPDLNCFCKYSVYLKRYILKFIIKVHDSWCKFTYSHFMYHSFTYLLPTTITISVSVILLLPITMVLGCCFWVVLWYFSLCSKIFIYTYLFTCMKHKILTSTLFFLLTLESIYPNFTYHLIDIF